MEIIKPRSTVLSVNSSIKKPLESIPPKNSDLLKAIMLFACYSRITKISPATVKKLKADPYFIYCFSFLVMDHTEIYKGNGFLPITTERLIFLLQNPDQATSKDLYPGLVKWLNNFVFNMPGGFYRDFPPSNIGDTRKRIFTAIDELLVKENKEKEHLRLVTPFYEERKRVARATKEIFSASHQGNRVFIPSEEIPVESRLTYYEFCLDIFNQLRKLGFTHQELWT